MKERRASHKAAPKLNSPFRERHTAGNRGTQSHGPEIGKTQLGWRGLAKTGPVARSLYHYIKDVLAGSTRIRGMTGEDQLRN